MLSNLFLVKIKNTIYKMLLPEFARCNLPGVIHVARNLDARGAVCGRELEEVVSSINRRNISGSISSTAFTCRNAGHGCNIVHVICNVVTGVTADDSTCRN